MLLFQLNREQQRIGLSNDVIIPLHIIGQFNSLIAISSWRITFPHVEDSDSSTVKPGDWLTDAWIQFNFLHRLLQSSYPW